MRQKHQQVNTVMGIKVKTLCAGKSHMDEKTRRLEPASSVSRAASRKTKITINQLVVNGAPARAWPWATTGL